MIFLGRILSWAMVVLGLIRTGTGLYVAYYLKGDVQVAAAINYFGSTTSGAAIDQGLVAIIAGVALGLLTMIAKNTQSN